MIPPSPVLVKIELSPTTASNECFVDAQIVYAAPINPANPDDHVECLKQILPLSGLVSKVRKHYNDKLMRLRTRCAGHSGYVSASKEEEDHAYEESALLRLVFLYLGNRFVHPP
jgi:hypothetical protein